MRQIGATGRNWSKSLNEFIMKRKKLAVLGLVLVVFLGLVLLNGGSMEKQARDRVDLLVHQEFEAGPSVRCTKVVLGREIGKGRYRAMAYFSNGNALVVYITKKGNSLDVSIPLEEN
jgi:hypothetical protein